jgi:hypothetical protein
MKTNERGHFVKVPLKTRFWEKVNAEGPFHPYDRKLWKCWVWTGTKLKRKHAYGLIWNDTHTKRLRAHRVAWELLRGKIPKGKDILHSCDNCSCVNPSHLRPGTSADNHKDMIHHGHSPIGEKNGMARLTEKQVMDILAHYPKATRTGPRDPREKRIIVSICKKHKISMNQAARIARGERWKHITK